MPTETLEEYLETIYKLAERGAVRPTPIAESLGVSGPTVTATLKRLESRELITRSGGDVVLTDAGRTLAVDIIRRHRLAERFLVDVLRLPWEEAHEDACRLEHALSPRVMEALEEYLDNPEVCPHGHPIPSAEGEIVPVKGVPLCDVDSGRTSEILQVSEDDEAMLTYLGSLGMYPGTPVRVCEVAPFKGPLLIEVNGTTYALGRDVAERILVSADLS
ncbi:MAG: metal-dependent transcriptional regulator [Anaerosomatales bacterium]|nr:metal-dependent transcriptional regulator [Anaerosomatales bacterium]MDT8433451.1 metal-dependent transcriptional regulator [Anaerosomatales bacterium]